MGIETCDLLCQARWAILLLVGLSIVLIVLGFVADWLLDNPDRAPAWLQRLAGWRKPDDCGFFCTGADVADEPGDAGFAAATSDEDVEYFEMWTPRGVRWFWQDAGCLEPMGPFDDREEAEADYEGCRV